MMNSDKHEFFQGVSVSGASHSSFVGQRRGRGGLLFIGSDAYSIV